MITPSTRLFRSKRTTILSSILPLTAIAICLVLVACEKQLASTDKFPTKLPTNATNVVKKGNGWTTFILDEQKYLYHRSFNGNVGYEAITAIPNTLMMELNNE